MCYTCPLVCLHRLRNLQDSFPVQDFKSTWWCLIGRWKNYLQDGTQAQYFMPQQIAKYATAVGRIAPLHTCFGFVDGTVRPICRPIRSQRALYNGHKRACSLKCQAVVNPDGLVIHFHGPLEGRHHDSTMLTDRGVMATLLKLASSS